MQQLMKQAQKMQQQLAAAQEQLAQAEVTGTAGGGMVTATMTGSGELTAIAISPQAVDPTTPRPCRTSWWPRCATPTGRPAS